MDARHVVIVGGGLAGLSAGCYARASGFRTTIVEHDVALGGVCTAWRRGPYLVDGCIHWLTGGPFERLYRELGIVPRVELRTLDEWVTYRDAREPIELHVTRDLGALARDLVGIGHHDEWAVRRLIDGARAAARLDPGIDAPQELAHLREAFARVWGMRRAMPALAALRAPFGAWLDAEIASERLRRVLRHMVPAEAPAFFLAMVLGYLEKGWLSRPRGGTAAFRDALIASYEDLGGDVALQGTVEEIVVRGGRACGVRLADGSMIDADVVISTSSMPETILHLLGGAYAAEETRRRLETWKLFEPIALVTLGVDAVLDEIPSTLLIGDVPPFDVGGRRNDHLYVRIFNDDAGYAPIGHTVVQLLLATDYHSWATCGARYAAEKEAVGRTAIAQLEQHLPGIGRTARVVDVATPLTYWSTARSWRGAYEGWMPRAAEVLTHVRRTLPGLRGFYLAGQWVEPGGGVPTAVMSGRHAVQLLCHDEVRHFGVPHELAHRATG